MTFQNPQLLLLIILLVPVGYLIRKSYIKNERVLKVFSEVNSDIHLRSVVGLYLSLIFMACMLFVASGPQRYIVTPGEDQSGSFVFLIDVSRSMAARPQCGDSMPLDSATSLMREIVTEIPMAGYSFVAYSELAFPLSEVSYDRQYLLQIIDNAIFIEAVPVPGSDLTNAFQVILEKKLEKPTLYADVRNIILLSDGDISEQVSEGLNQVLPSLRGADIRITSVGIGSEDSSPIPTIDENGECIEGQYERSEGREFYTHLFEEPLRFIAEETGGRYFNVSEQYEIVQYLRTTLVTTPGLEPPVQTEDISFPFLMFSTVSLFGLLWFRRL